MHIPVFFASEGDSATMTTMTNILFFSSIFLKSHHVFKSFLFTIFLNSRSLNSIFKSRHDLGLFEVGRRVAGNRHALLTKLHSESPEFPSKLKPWNLCMSYMN
uniref:Uncharacterized protein n=1 Tax=Rhizophagus irregularis (strain DAOM 181602 / DAOM 197198 / MUCL 43194) TaxID=747089 RepID=U9T0Q4_RHIID